MKSKYLAIALLSFFLLTCSSKKKSESNTTTHTSKNVSIGDTPVFSADSAYVFINDQVAFGPRIPNTKAHTLCGDYIIEKLKKYGCTVTVQSFTKKAFDGTSLNLRNIIGSVNPTSSKRILLAAHWDTRPFADQEKDMKLKKKPIDGANDGASGVGVLLEIARILQQSEKKLHIGVDFIFFDGEDYGQPDFLELPETPNSWCLGSQYWCEHRHQPGYQAYYGILLDMVGAKNAVFAMEGASMNYAPEITRKIWDIAAASGFGHMFIPLKADPIVDDHYYINVLAKIPMTDIIEYNVSDDNGAYFGSYWHTLQDNMRVIDKNTLKGVGQTVTNVLYAEQ